MNESEENPVFSIDEETGTPILHLIPDKAVCTLFINFQDEDITSDEDVQDLILDIYHRPEVEFYYYQEYEKEINKYLSQACNSGKILMNYFEYFYYKHPNFSDYVKIQKHNIKFDWEREVMESTPMFIKTRVLLSKSQEMHLSILQAIETEKQINNSTKDCSELVVTKLNWDKLSDDEFERLIYCLISDAPGYENPEWLTQTNAPDRGRDLSVIRVQEDLLSGTHRSRVIVQCKHWLSKSINLTDVAMVVAQMQLWEPPVDDLIITTSGRFTSDAVAMIEKHNYAKKAPFIRMWPNSHLERLLAARPNLMAKFQLK
jgi:hypothetical protein